MGWLVVGWWWVGGQVGRWVCEAGKRGAGFLFVRAPGPLTLSMPSTRRVGRWSMTLDLEHDAVADKVIADP